ncbi:hypothetical protein QH639_18145 [Lysinibacillus sp. 1 U-2021]|uniref:hypothetical protein n=1 Tax=Lysinibacillus sp. 1 U-2021 TaxID=3039426 RepID=UPI0024800AF4|nr:hypothetical protein [Lysinibacillus sp. 1 U-2021]WGT37741.1 hypothetical protein QH639_18145 [Lysinibacillus sp. 1 U-2021]
MRNNKHKLHDLKLGDIIRFPNDEFDYVVRHVGLRYVFVGSDCGCVYTIIDKKDEVLASTTMTFEEFANFTVEGNAQKLETLLTNGDRELSRKYRDTFKDFNYYKGKVIKA